MNISHLGHLRASHEVRWLQLKAMMLRLEVVHRTWYSMIVAKLTTQKLVHEDATDRHPEKDVQMYEAVSSLSFQGYRPGPHPNSVGLTKFPMLHHSYSCFNIEVSYIHARLLCPNQTPQPMKRPPAGKFVTDLRF